ncbi:type VII secretion integral membrane protein EccD [Rhodococcus sp. HM1]|uniref:type VII secretion integral membrane protein EccD n=1 Tax=Rhodococcus sp. HM1 TaxID=2937759 RepID=UPI00200ACF68|nr:type VII secretion integral membrane protein EccD [Rhodococcus sp. HM1]MCK8673776.1 type VII secretion integral membrane protein EccD [Rhodococcus sp. HM1]
MTATHIDPTRAGAEPSRGIGAPDLCRITVLTRHSQVDLALPLGVPVALLVPGIVDLVAAHRTDNDFDSTPDQVEPDRWTLARLGRAPLSGALALEEHGIRDGELLVLENAAASAPPPLFDDVMYHVAVAGRDRLRRWSAPVAQSVAAVVAVLAVVVGSAALLQTPAGTERATAGAATAIATLLLVVAAAVLHRVYRDRAVALLLSVCAIPAAFTTGLLLVPGDYDLPHLLLGAVLTGTVAVVVLRLAAVGTATFTAVATVAAVTAIASTVAVYVAVPVASVGAGLVLAGLLAGTLAPRIAIMLARLPLPPVPAPGTSLDPVVADPDDTNPAPTFDELEAGAALARSYLTGLVYAVVVLTAAGAWCAAIPRAGDGIEWPGVALAAASGIALMFRGRTHAGAETAAPLVLGGGLVLLGLLTGAAITDAAPPIVLFSAASVLLVGALVFGVVAPRRTFTPVQRRFAEITEYAVVATIVPLACWVLGLYSAVRGI